jgi:hypothetical protein
MTHTLDPNDALKKLLGCILIAMKTTVTKRIQDMSSTHQISETLEIISESSDVSKISDASMLVQAAAIRRKISSDLLSCSLPLLAQPLKRAVG